MPSTNSRSSLTERARRAGFTLLELMISVGVGLIVMGAVVQAYFGANKAQATAVGGGILKVSGQKALNDIYRLLHQNRHLFSRNDVTPTFLGRLPIRPYDTAGLSPGLPSPDPYVDLRLPLAKEDGSFLRVNDTGTVPPGWDANAVGNSLFFATVEPKVSLNESGAAPIHNTLFGGSTYLLQTLKLHFYYLARRDLAVTANAVRSNERFVYNLMHWESEPYVDYSDLVKWMNMVKDSGNAGGDALIDAKLSSLQTTTKPLHFAGAIDIGAADARTTASPPAIYQLTATGTRRELVSWTGTLKTKRFGSAVDFSMKSAFGEPMVAFNTGPSAAPTSVPVNGLDVPAYADDNTAYPMGFEVMVAGPPELRRVLLRLSLAARTMPGKVMIGQSFQQVVQIYEYGGADATPEPAASP